MDPGVETAARKIRFVVFDFDGVFTDNRVLVTEDGKEAVLCSRADGFGLAATRAAGLQMMILSTEVNAVVGARARKLNIDCVQGCDDKAACLREEAARRGFSLDQTAYLGNDVNDLPCLRIVGLPACVADAYPQVIAASQFVTVRRGGQGAVREFCEWLLCARGAPANYDAL